MHQAKLWASQAFEGKFIADTYIQYHRAVQLLTTIPRLAKLPFGHQTACTDHHCASEKQQAKADHSSVVVLNMKSISLFMYHSVYDEKLNLLTWAIRLIFSG